jgi:hypothetical protein
MEGGREWQRDRGQLKRQRDRETQEIERQKVVQLCRDAERLKG